MTLVAYHNEPALKERLIRTMREHREAERLVPGIYWEPGRGGCAVGCLLKDPDGGHARYEAEFGIPRVLAHLEDRIFESLRGEEQQAWPECFLEAIPIGADLSLVWPRFAVWLLTDPEHGAARHDPSGSCERVAALYRRLIAGHRVSHEEWVDARRAAARAHLADTVAAGAAVALAVAAAHAVVAHRVAYVVSARTLLSLLADAPVPPGNASPTLRIAVKREGALKAVGATV